MKKINLGLHDNYCLYRTSKLKKHSLHKNIEDCKKDCNFINCPVFKKLIEI